MEERLDVHNSSIPKLCRSCEVRHRGICGALKPEELLELSKYTRRVDYPAGKEISGDSEDVVSYSTIMHGVVKLSKMLEDGRQQVVGLQFAPDLIGRMFSIKNHFTAEAASNIQLCKMPKAALERLIKKNPEIEHKLLEQTLRELDEAREWMVTLGRKTAAEKVACFLYLIATHIDPTYIDGNLENLTFELPLTRADIADFLGLTIETVSRQFTKLRTDGIIEISVGRNICVPDLAKLKERCG